MNLLVAGLSSWTQFGSALGNHLWQSTVFAAVAALLTLLLRKNHAGTRYWLWLAASLKFLLPFALFIAAGTHLQWWKQTPAPQSQVSIVMDQITQPFAPLDAQRAPSTVPSTPATGIRKWPFAVLTVWFIGFAALLIFWCVRWRRITRAIHDSKPLESGRELELLRGLERGLGLAHATRIVSGGAALEPGIVGIIRPVMFLPAGIAERLNDSQLSAVMLHELCHLRRRDNLAAVLHMVVESVFWFHPLVWWMGAQLIDERERACDEEVLALGSEPQAYAEGILKVCEFYLETPLVCVAGITGSNLKKRIEAIMIHRIAHKLELGKKLLLATIAAAALIAPVVFGLFHPAESLAQTAHTAGATTAGFESVFIQPNTTGKAMPPFNIIAGPDGNFVGFKFSNAEFRATHATLPQIIRMAYGVLDFQISGGPDWLSREKYDVAARFLNGMEDAKFWSLPQDEQTSRMDQRRLELQALLADRFRLVVHRETRQLPIYSLTIAANGPKLQKASPGDAYANGMKRRDGVPMGAGLWVPQSGVILGQGVSTAALAVHLSQQLGRVIVDNTGLSGKYDFKLQFAPGKDQSTSLLSAIPEQLGLQLTPQTGPVEMIVIDRAEPAETVAGTGSLIKPVSIQAQRPDTQSRSGELQDVSIKPLGPATTEIIRERFTVMNGEANFTGTLREIIKFAYQVNDAQLSGGPAWLTTDLYEVTAKVPKGSHFNSALQKVLADRFKLAVHRELKELPAYAMVVGANGSKLTEAPTEKNQHFSITHNPLGHVTGNAATIHDLATVIQFQVGQMVIDKTGLNGHYDFTLTVPNWTHPAKTPEDAAPFLQAVSQQLGLELKPTTNLVEVLVIDHVESVTADPKQAARY
jgi:bla regulator protein blaR1